MAVTAKTTINQVVIKYIKDNEIMSQTKNIKSGKYNKEKKSGFGKIAAILVSAMVVVIITIILLVGNAGGNGSNTAAIKDSDLVIAKGEISEIAKFYPVEIEGTKLEVIAVKAPDNTIRTAFNTCQVCFDSGRGYYVQEGDVLVCQNCGNRFRMSDVEVTRGGCNPVPITAEDKTVTDTAITISKEFLAKAKVIFENWKR